jgi:large subunit ribosomal protein L4
MATLKVHNSTGAEVGTIEVNTEALAASINKQLMHDAVVMYQANLRQGSHNTKTRGEVSGHKKKLFRQKGTGNARAGQKNAPQRRGGGLAYTVKPRDYSYRLNKKALRLATRMAIRSKIDDNETIVIDALDMSAPKTSQVAKTLKALGLSEATTLVVTEETNAIVYKSVRNIPGVEVQPVRELNALSVLKPKRMLVTKAAMLKIADGSFAEPAPL